MTQGSKCGGNVGALSPEITGECSFKQGQHFWQTWKVKHRHSLWILPHPKRWCPWSSAHHNNLGSRGQQPLNQDQAASDWLIQFKGWLDSVWAPTKPQSSSPTSSKVTSVCVYVCVCTCIPATATYFAPKYSFYLQSEDVFGELGHFNCSSKFQRELRIAFKTEFRPGVSLVGWGKGLYWVPKQWFY